MSEEIKKEQDVQLNPEELDNVPGGSIFGGGGSFEVYCNKCGTKMIPLPEAGKGVYVCPNCDK